MVKAMSISKTIHTSKMRFLIFYFFIILDIARSGQYILSQNLFRNNISCSTGLEIRHLLFSIFISATALKCYVGSSDGKVSMDCYPGLNRCVKFTPMRLPPTSAYSCTSASIILRGGINDNGCTTTGAIETCVCNTDNCNGDQGSLSK